MNEFHFLGSQGVKSLIAQWKERRKGIQRSASRPHSLPISVRTLGKSLRIGGLRVPKTMPRSLGPLVTQGPPGWAHSFVLLSTWIADPLLPQTDTGPSKWHGRKWRWTWIPLAKQILLLPLSSEHFCLTVTFTTRAKGRLCHRQLNFSLPLLKLVTETFHFLLKQPESGQSSPQPVPKA